MAKARSLRDPDNPSCSLLTSCVSNLQHVRQQYEDIRPILEAMVVAYPAYMQPEWFTWEAYLWAVQLWYAYAMQVCHMLPCGLLQPDCDAG